MNFNKLPKVPKEEKLRQEEFNRQMNIIKEEAEEFAGKLIQQHLQVQVLVQAPQALVNALNQRVMKTAAWKASMEHKKKLDTSSLLALELEGVE